MKILICGATGFIGRHLAQTLQDAGHQVWHGARAAQGAFAMAIDYHHDLDSTRWQTRVRGMDAVINAAGILPGSPDEFARMHTLAPTALFEACRQTGVKRFVQISALANGAHLPPFLASKHAFDAHILATAQVAPSGEPASVSNRYSPAPMNSLIVRPSLVVGIDGSSSQWFRSLASMPLMILPGNGEQQVQPVHIDDLCFAVKHWIEQATTRTQVVNAVGPRALSYRAMLTRYRSEMGLPAAPCIPLSMALMRSAGTLLAPVLQWARRLRHGSGGGAGMLEAALSADNLAMLDASNTADCAQFARLLGRPQQERWLGNLPPAMLRHAAIAGWANPLLRCSLALLWWGTALVSGALYPREDSLTLLAPLHLPHALALLCLYGATLLDFAFGVTTLWRPSRRLWWLQILLILGYSLIISVTLPAFWLHPFGPILKNLPILALLFMLLAQETHQ